MWSACRPEASGASASSTSADGPVYYVAVFGMFTIEAGSMHEALVICGAVHVQDSLLVSNENVV